MHDVSSTYLVPITLEKQGLIPLMSRILDQSCFQRKAEQVENIWESPEKLVEPQEHLEGVTVALVGKFTGSLDACMSLVKSLQHGAMGLRHNLDLVLVNASHLELHPPIRHTQPRRMMRHGATKGILVSFTTVLQVSLEHRGRNRASRSRCCRLRHCQKPTW
ncbi:hypothetical protein F4680DRAFT_400043 [Xylaria scruposa]|nr:hypothetical protein F4680DRAFT_400043 [Xylaria scruposa]